MTWIVPNLEYSVCNYMPRNITIGAISKKCKVVIREIKRPHFLAGV